MTFRHLKLPIFIIFSVSIFLLGHISIASPSDKKDVHSYDISFLAYNVCGLPDYITSTRNLIVPSKKRLTLIADLIKNYDVMGLQEVFIPDRTVFENKLRFHFLARGTDSPMANPTGSGIYVFSKGVINRSMFERWNVQYDVDAFSHKGFVGATTRLRDDLYVDVFSLHAQASANAEARIANYKQLLDAINWFSKNSKRPIVVLGDFNCQIGELECSWFIDHSGFKLANNEPYNVDNIFYSENGSEWNISVQSSKYVFDYLVNGRLISDHKGLEAILRFTKKH